MLGISQAVRQRVLVPWSGVRIPHPQPVKMHRQQSVLFYCLSDMRDENGTATKAVPARQPLEPERFVGSCRRHEVESLIPSQYRFELKSKMWLCYSLNMGIELDQQRHFEAVDPPNSRPSGSRFNTSTENYVAGFPEIKPPQWLVDEAARFAGMRSARLELAIDLSWGSRQRPSTKNT